jgi:pSer/pThr/pTyr-binding forkhead associated (FHA) protein
MRAQLLVVQGRPRGKCLTFPRGEFVFGRGPECHVRPDSPSVSRQHCLLRVETDSVSIRDLMSTNGTLVNGTRLLGERLLEEGDRVQIGPLVLRFHLLAEEDLPTPANGAQNTQIIPPTAVSGQDEPAALPDPLEPTDLSAPSLPPHTVI